MAFHFVSVYKVRDREKPLLKLLKQRPAFMNISHKRLPTPAEHRCFVRSKPYKEWNFITENGWLIGSIYLTAIDEIGIFLFKDFRGREKRVLREFIAARKGRRFLANVSVKNKEYAAIFRSLGFKHIQNTYCLER